MKVHIRGIMKKLQARNRTEVAFKMHNLAKRPTAARPGWSTEMSASTPADPLSWLVTS